MNSTLNLTTLRKPKPKQEWEPYPEIDSVLSPSRDKMLTLLGSGKWFQILQITLLSLTAFYFLPKMVLDVDEYAIGVSCCLAAFFVVQFLYSRSSASKTEQAISHYDKYNNTLSSDELNNYIRLTQQYEKAQENVKSAVLGIVICCLFGIVAAMMEILSLSNIKDNMLIILWVLTSPSIVAWVCIHYKAKGFLVWLAMFICGVFDAVAGMLLSPCLLCGGALVLAVLKSVDDVLRFFAVYVSALLLFGACLYSWLYSLFSAPNYTAVGIAIAFCVAPAFITIVLKSACSESDAQKQQEMQQEGKAALLMEPGHERIFNILYTYVWGGLCTIFFVTITILGFVSDEYNWSQSLRNNFSSFSKRAMMIDTCKPIDYSVDLDAYKRFDRSYSDYNSRSYGDYGSRNYGSRSYRDYDYSY